jgi:hypothetical protein
VPGRLIWGEGVSGDTHVGGNVMVGGVVLAGVAAGAALVGAGLEVTWRRPGRCGPRSARSSGISLSAAFSWWGR